MLSRSERPVRAARQDAGDEPELPPAEDEDDEPDGEVIDESESEAAPAATD